MDLKPPSRPEDQDLNQAFRWEPLYPPSPGDLQADPWHDPHEEHNLLRRRIQKLRLGFLILGLSMVVFSMSTMGNLVMMFGGPQQPIAAQLGIPQWRLIEGIIITWGSLLGVLLLCGRWPDIHWQRRSGILLLMCLVDAVLWTLDNATEMGLHEGKIGHEWFRSSLGTALSWSEFALMASLSADAATHLGRPQASDFARSVRSLATTGAMVWFMYFYFMTRWKPPIWPLQHRGLNPGTGMLLLAWLVLSAIVTVLATGLTLLAGRCCAHAVREMAQQDHGNDLLPSRSEEGWDDLNRDSGPKRGT